MVVYAALVAGFLTARRAPIIKSLTLAAAFGMLDGAMAQAFPDMGSSFTWNEGLDRARKLRLDVNWGRVDKEFHEYEAFRYGGSADPGAGGYEVTRLAALLRRGGLGF